METPTPDESIEGPQADDQGADDLQEAPTAEETTAPAAEEEEDDEDDDA